MVCCNVLQVHLFLSHDDICIEEPLDYSSMKPTNRRVWPGSPLSRSDCYPRNPFRCGVQFCPYFPSSCVHLPLDDTGSRGVSKSLFTIFLSHCSERSHMAACRGQTDSRVRPSHFWGTWLHIGFLRIWPTSTLTYKLFENELLFGYCACAAYLMQWVVSFSEEEKVQKKHRWTAFPPQDRVPWAQNYLASRSHGTKFMSMYPCNKWVLWSWGEPKTKAQGLCLCG